MPSANESSSNSKTGLWIGRILSALGVLFMLFDSAIHLMKPPHVVQSFAQLGYPVTLATTFGIVELACLVIYLIPPTSILGVVLLTGYLGGAVATNARIGNPLFSHTLFPVYVGVVLWGGLYLRDNQLRDLFPIRRETG